MQSLIPIYGQIFRAGATRSQLSNSTRNAIFHEATIGDALQCRRGAQSTERREAVDSSPVVFIDGDRAAVTILFFSTFNDMGTLLLMYGDLASCV